MGSKVFPQLSLGFAALHITKRSISRPSVIFRYNAVVILTMIPVFIITLIFQRQIVEGHHQRRLQVKPYTSNSILVTPSIQQPHRTGEIR